MIVSCVSLSLSLCDSLSLTTCVGNSEHMHVYVHMAYFGCTDASLKVLSLKLQLKADSSPECCRMVSQPHGSSFNTSFQNVFYPIQWYWPILSSIMFQLQSIAMILAVYSLPSDTIHGHGHTNHWLRTESSLPHRAKALHKSTGSLLLSEW